MVRQRELVLIAYPFSEFNASKVRPAVVVSNDRYNQEFDDVIVVPVTTNVSLRKHVVRLSNSELEQGHLIAESVIKVDRVLSMNQKLIRKTIGFVNKDVLVSIRSILAEILGD